jgi:hypothetical protein
MRTWVVAFQDKPRHKGYFPPKISHTGYLRRFRGQNVRFVGKSWHLGRFATLSASDPLQNFAHLDGRPV